MAGINSAFALGLLSVGSLTCASPFKDDPKLWTRNVAIESPRANIYGFNDEDFREFYFEGKKHTLSYPVSVTGLMIPPIAFKRALEMNPLSKFRFIPSTSLTRIRNLKEFYDFLGLADFQSRKATHSYEIARPAYVPKEHRVGAQLVASQWGGGLSFSCAACHASNFFGHTVWGLPNKQTRANRIFESIAKIAPFLEPHMLRIATQMPASEFAMMKRSIANIKSVRPKQPQSLGLDTSLAHVARSLGMRQTDAYATKSAYYRRFPRSTYLDHHVADSKPGTFWVLKYKNRWLSDGSVVSGNPILTNILWNEIGRGGDLHELERWMTENEETIGELTTAVFASEAPRWSEIFPSKPINLASAMRGEKLFNQTCAGCHGTYEKQWSEPASIATESRDPFVTTQVVYHERTPVIDVGTDAGRREGMIALAEPLNRLAISQRNGVRVEVQKGYVPPPLVGIFARYPYLHNNSVPNLCALLTPAPKRPKTFVQGPSVNAKTDFDADCVGYPVGKDIPKAWVAIPEGRYDTAKQGLSNRGHDMMLFERDGRERFTALEKVDLIEFLKTL